MTKCKYIYLFFFVLVVLSLLQRRIEALPGWGVKETKQWLQKHNFLIPPKEGMGYGDTFGSYRELKDNNFVFTIYTVKYERIGESYYPSKIYEDIGI